MGDFIIPWRRGIVDERLTLRVKDSFKSSLSTFERVFLYVVRKYLTICLDYRNEGGLLKKMVTFMVVFFCYGVTLELLWNYLELLWSYFGVT
jgi:hypothetical protein